MRLHPGPRVIFQEARVYSLDQRENSLLSCSLHTRAPESPELWPVLVKDPPLERYGVRSCGERKAEQKLITCEKLDFSDISNLKKLIAGFHKVIKSFFFWLTEEYIEYNKMEILVIPIR